jgi:hypothetical protein
MYINARWHHLSALRYLLHQRLELIEIIHVPCHIRRQNTLLHSPPKYRALQRVQTRQQLRALQYFKTLREMIFLLHRILAMLSKPLRLLGNVIAII